MASLRALLTFLLLMIAGVGRGDTVFVEAEGFEVSSEGWQIATGPETRQASGVATLHGADGAVDATASQRVTLSKGGHYRVWVRFESHPTLRGPFEVAVMR